MTSLEEQLAFCWQIMQMRAYWCIFAVLASIYLFFDLGGRRIFVRFWRRARSWLTSGYDYATIETATSTGEITYLNGRYYARAFATAPATEVRMRSMESDNGGSRVKITWDVDPGPVMPGKSKPTTTMGMAAEAMLVDKPFAVTSRVPRFVVQLGFKPRDGPFQHIGMGFRAGSFLVSAHHVLEALSEKPALAFVSSARDSTLPGVYLDQMLMDSSRWSSLKTVGQKRPITGHDIAAIELFDAAWSRLAVRPVSIKDIDAGSSGVCFTVGPDTNGAIRESCGSIKHLPGLRLGLFEHTCSTIKGWSGSPIIVERGSVGSMKTFLRGMHVGGTTDHGGHNVAINGATLYDALIKLGVFADPATLFSVTGWLGGAKTLPYGLDTESDMPSIKDDRFDIHDDNEALDRAIGYLATYWVSGEFLGDPAYGRGKRASRDEFEARQVVRDGLRSSDPAVRAQAQELQQVMDSIASRNSDHDWPDHGARSSFDAEALSPDVQEAIALAQKAGFIIRKHAPPKPVLSDDKKKMLEDLGYEVVLAEKPEAIGPPGLPEPEDVESEKGDSDAGGVEEERAVPKHVRARAEAEKQIRADYKCSRKQASLIRQGKLTKEQINQIMKDACQGAGVPTFGPVGFSSIWDEDSEFYCPECVLPDAFYDGFKPTGFPRPYCAEDIANREPHAVVLGFIEHGWDALDGFVMDPDTFYESSACYQLRRYVEVTGAAAFGKSEPKERDVLDKNGRVLFESVGYRAGVTRSKEQQVLDSRIGAVFTEHFPSFDPTEYVVPSCTPFTTLESLHAHAAQLDVANYSMNLPPSVTNLNEPFQDIVRNMPSVVPRGHLGARLWKDLVRDVVREADRTKSSGFSSRYFPGSKGACLDSFPEFMAIVAQRAVLRHLVGAAHGFTLSPEECVRRGLMDPKLPNTKGEPHKRSKADKKLWRQIIVPSFVDTFLDCLGGARDVSKVVTDMYSAEGPLGFEIGMGHHDEGLRTTFARAERMRMGSYAPFESDDVSNWDWIQTEDHTYLAKFIYVSLNAHAMVVAAELHPEYNAADVRAVVARCDEVWTWWALCRNHSCYCVGPHEFVQRVKGIQDSGNNLTTVTNTSNRRFDLKASVYIAGRLEQHNVAYEELPIDDMTNGDDQVRGRPLTEREVEVLDTVFHVKSKPGSILQDTRRISFTSHEYDLYTRSVTFLNTNKLLSRVLSKAKPVLPLPDGLADEVGSYTGEVRCVIDPDVLAGACFALRHNTRDLCNFRYLLSALGLEVPRRADWYDDSRT